MTCNGPSSSTERRARSTEGNEPGPRLRAGSEYPQGANLATGGRRVASGTSDRPRPVGSGSYPRHAAPPEGSVVAAGATPRPNQCVLTGRRQRVRWRLRWRR